MVVPNKPRLLDQVSEKIRFKHYSSRTKKAYVHWIRRFIIFHGKQHPRDLRAREIEEFLTCLAVKQKVASTTQNQAFNALLFLYKQVLDIELPRLENIARAKRPQRLPVVLTVAEVRAILAQLDGVRWIIASLLYGAGLRLMECMKLRVKDVDFSMHQITIRDGKGFKDRTTMLPDALDEGLQTHLLQSGYDIRTVQELLGHRDVKTTMIYTHVLNRGGRGVLSPLDQV